MFPPSLQAVLMLGEDARLLYFSLRAAADGLGRIANRVALVRRLVLGDTCQQHVEELMNELRAAGLVRITPGGAWIELSDYREGDPRPDWAELKAGPPHASPPSSVSPARPGAGPVKRSLTG